MDKLKELKFNIRERQVPFFDDEELEVILSKHDGNVEDASYECLILKSEATGLNVTGLTTKDSSSYFRMLASQYVPNNSGVLIGD